MKNAAYYTSLVLLACLLADSTCFAQQEKRQPNIVIILFDDMGYADISPFNEKINYTPNIQRIANGGVKYTDFYVSQPVCSASRASLLTGCYANRLGIHNALMPHSKVSLDTAEVTLADMLKTKGYATGMFGKWHLGDDAAFMPNRQGFDVFEGIAFSNDMWPHHPDTSMAKKFGPLIYYKNEIPADTLHEQSKLTAQLTAAAVSFIQQNKNGPFFLYMPHPQPHCPVQASDKFKGKTRLGAYPDAVAELDWSVGEIYKTLKTNKLLEDTWIIITSDNGPWLSYGNHAGSAGPLREGKGTCFEGGVRVPAVMHWKQVLPAGVEIANPLMTIDLLPTIAAVVKAPLPARKIDGINVLTSLLRTQPYINERPLFFYYAVNELQAMRWKNWKLYFPHSYRTMAGQPMGNDGQPGPYRMQQIRTIELYDLAEDVGEKKNVAAQHADVVRAMQAMAGIIRAELGDSLQMR